MFLYISLIFTFHLLTFLILLKHIYVKEPLKSNKKYRIKFSIIIISISFILTTTIYIKQSNFWVGESILEKITNNKNYSNLPSLETEEIFLLISRIEEELKKDPENVSKLNKLAKIKYLLGDFKGALQAFKKAREIEPSNFELLIGEANSRAIIENEEISKYTILLFEKILEKEENNLLALLILADYASEKNNLKKAKNYYIKLLGLLKKDSKEFIEVKEKIIMINEKINKNAQ